MARTPGASGFFDTFFIILSIVFHGIFMEFERILMEFSGFFMDFFLGESSRKSGNPRNSRAQLVGP